MKAAVICRDGVISEGFGKASGVIIYEIDRSHDVIEKTLIPVEGTGHIPVSGILIKNRVHAVICNRIGASAFALTQNMHAHVFAGVTGDPDEAVQKLLRRELTELKEPDCIHSEEEAGCDGDCASCTYH